MYKTIIIPVDISHAEKAQQMLEVAHCIKDDDAKLLLLNVIEDVPAYAAAELPADLMGNSKRKAREVLEELARGHSDAEIEVRQGAPHFQILEAAEERDADLIIIASHKPGLKDYFLGSTASRVVRHALCPVHVIR